jgi:hypothetical protein
MKRQISSVILPDGKVTLTPLSEAAPVGAGGCLAPCQRQVEE